MKKPNRIILTISIVLISLIAVTMILINENIRIAVYEENYKSKLDSESLSKLCLNIQITDKYVKKIEYFPILMSDPKALEIIKKSIDSDYDIDMVYDEYLSDYMFSYLYSGQLDDFKKSFTTEFPKCKTSGYKYDNILKVILDEKITDIQLKTLLESLQSISGGALVDQIGNLNMQSAIYKKLGDAQNFEVVKKKTDEIWALIKKINDEKYG